MKVAFQIQRDRIEFDWSQYSKQMYNSYKMRRAELTGESFTPEPTEFDQPAYWKEREKQEKLVYLYIILIFFILDSYSTNINSKYTSTKYELSWTNRKTGTKIGYDI